MSYVIQAACGCHTGRIRSNNEDNFYFGGKCLEKDNNGLEHPVFIEQKLKNRYGVAVFDGMGGENFGELASYAAARQMQLTERSLSHYFIPEKHYLKRLTQQLNDTVVRAQHEMCTERMGSTMAALYFFRNYAYVCNVGDSRAYRMRNGELLQLSTDDVEKYPGAEYRKAPLTQYLGFGSDEMELELHITKEELMRGDMYLLCSDGLTDMLSNSEIFDIMHGSASVESCVQTLIDSALEHGGRDNITAVVCKLL